MPLPRPFRRRSAPAESPLDPAAVPAPAEGLGAAAAEAAEAAAQASAAAWVEEPGEGPPLDPPGWFRDEPLADSHGTGRGFDADPQPAPQPAAQAPAADAPTAGPATDAAAVPPSPEDTPAEGMVADAAVPEPAEGVVADAAPEPAEGVVADAAPEPAEGVVADAAPEPAEGVAGDAATAIAPEAPSAVPDASVSETAPGDIELEDTEPDAVALPGTIYRTDPLPPEDAVLRPRRRSPVASVLLGLLILVAVGVGGFGIGLLLPLLIPLPAGNASVASLSPTVPSASTPPGVSPAVSGSPTASASASPSASPSPSPAATPRIYVVKRGDQLGRIAAQFGITLQAIEAANNIANPNLIIPGQKLVIPAPSGSPLASPGASPSAGP